LGNYETEIRRLSAGCSVRATGTVAASEGQGQSYELQASAIEVVGWVEDPETYPIQPKAHSLEFLREVAHLRPRTNLFGAVTRIRHCMAQAIHRFFHEEGFYWINTPIISTSDAEGAGQMFRISTLDMMNLPRTSKGEVDFSKDFFGKEAGLTVSGQLSAEMFALALGDVYTFGPTFRAENSNTSRHVAEFWMVEPEMAFCDLQGDMDWAESFLKYVFGYVLEHCPEDMEFFNLRIDKSVLETAQLIIDQPFERMTYTEAVARLEKSQKKFEYPVEWGIDLQSEHERYLTEELIQRPVIVTDYPKGIKAFYMRLNNDQKTVAAMDILVPKIGELVGGSQREERLEVLEARMKAQNLNLDDYWWYLDLRRYGTVPHAGFGLGFERLVQFMTGMQNIRDVIPFPRAPMSADF
jgi:asparaginyl-tRNA synthetase